MIPTNAPITVAAPPDAGADSDTTTSSSSSPSRLAHLLESNDLPLESEIPLIRHIIADNQARVGALNARINILQIATERLIAERDERQECIRKHTTALSPVRRVPPEVMCQIFAWTLPHSRRIARATVHCAPWHVSHICRSWRDWALANPSLWTTIEISNKHRAFDLRDPYPLYMLETQLLRSGNMPLTVAFAGQDYGDVAECALWDLFLPLCDRWSTVRLRSVTGFHTLSNLLDVVRGRVPQLKKLELLVNYSNTLGQPDYFSIAPNLREVILTDPECNIRSSLLRIPWEQITHYRGLYSAERQFEILSEAASNLVECSLGFVHHPRDILSDKVITLPHLRRLFVADTDFLTALTAPVLRVLYSLRPMDPLLDFVTRSSCRLTTLVLEHCFSADTLVRILRDIPSLEYLLVEVRNWNSAAINTFFNAMALSGTSSDLCPSLSSLIFGHESSNIPMSDAYLLPMVVMTQSRLLPTSPRSLSSLRFFGDYASKRMRIAFAQKTQVLVDQGLDVALLSTIESKALMAKNRL